MKTLPEKFASFNWMRGVFGDKRISIIHRFILTRLVVYRRKDGRCDPGYDPVAKELGVDRTTVMRAVDVGVRFGWLAPPVRGRRANANFVFTFADQEVAPESDFKEDDQEVAPESDFKGDQEVAPDELRSRSKRVKKSLKKEAFRATSKASTEHGHLTGKENGQGEKDSPPDVAALGVKKARKRLAREARIKPEAEPNRDAETAEKFSRFWAVYPRHDNEERARKEFARAVIDTDPESIIAGAQRYAVAEQLRLARPGQTPQHTAMAHNWLHDRRWHDPPPPGAVIDEAGNIIEIEEEEDEGGEEAEIIREIMRPTW